MNAEKGKKKLVLDFVRTETFPALTQKSFHTPTHSKDSEKRGGFSFKLEIIDFK